MSEARKNSDLTGFTLVELLVVLAIFSLLAMLLLPVLSKATEGARKSSCMSNMREMSFALHIFANEMGDGIWPHKSEAEQNLMFDFESMHPRYMESNQSLFCPSDINDNPERFIGITGQGWINTDTSLNIEIVDGTWIPGAPRPPTWPTWPDADQTLPPEDRNAPPSDVSYTYLGWAFHDPAFMEPLGAFLLTYQQAITDKKVDQDLKFTHPGNATIAPGTEITIYRLRDGISRFYITDLYNDAASVNAISNIAVLWDNFGTSEDYVNHFPFGSNVLYMDGHVEFLLLDPDSRTIPIVRVMSEFSTAVRQP